MKAQNNRAEQHLEASELILNPDGSIFHLHLQPEQIAPTVLVVGDQGRVEMVSKHFDRVDHVVQNREFCTHTGVYNGRPVSALSTGIGTDNIDIVMNELDALVNVDLHNRKVKSETKSLKIVRLGTCGGLQKEAAPGDFIVSRYGLGLDGMLNYYSAHFEEDEMELQKELISHLRLGNFGIQPYVARANDELFDLLREGNHFGITATANGFYAPQGRAIRLEPELQNFNDRLESFTSNGLRVMNYEMETSALFGLGGSLGHSCCTVCVVIANRVHKKALVDYKHRVNDLIEQVLSRLTN